MQFKKYLPVLKAIAISIVVIFAIDFWLDLRHGDDRRITEEVTVGNKVDKLKTECLELSVGTRISDADLILSSRNRRTKTTAGTGGGHIRYWNSESPTQLIPIGGICKVTFDSRGAIRGVFWVD